MTTKATAKQQAAAKAKAATEAKRKKQAAAAAAAKSKAKHTATLTALAPIAKEINHKLDQAGKSEAKADDYRLSASIRLAEAKTKCEADKLPFKKWAEENVTQAYETVRKLVAIGSAKDPAAALAETRTKNKAANKKLRDTSKEGSRDTKAIAAKPSTPFEQAERGLSALDDNARLNVLESQASKLGMQVLAKAQVSKLVRDADKATGKKTDLTGLKQAFGELKASEQMEFVNYAADAVGATVEVPFAEPKTDAEIQADIADIPKALKAKGKGTRQRRAA